MSDAIKLIIAIIILIVISPLISEYAGSQIDDQAKTQSEQNDAKNTGNKFLTNDVVCDIEITIHGELDIDRNGLPRILQENFPILTGSTELLVYMGDKAEESQIADVIHRNCFTVGDGFGSAFNWLAGAYSLTGNNGLQKLGLLTSPLDNFELKFTGKTKDGNSNLVEKINSSAPEREWSQLVDVNFGEIDKLPWKFSETYFLDDVKNDDYVLTIIAEGRSINEKLEGTGITYDLQKVIFE